MLSVVIATALWYMVSIRDRIEMQIDVSIDYIGIPKNLIVTDGRYYSYAEEGRL